MRGYSFLIDSGKKLELSDVVDDEDDFYKILSDELYKNVTGDMMIMAGEYYIDVDDFDAPAAMNECLDNGRYGWVLDPQGVTFPDEILTVAADGRMKVSELSGKDRKSSEGSSAGSKKKNADHAG